MAKDKLLYSKTNDIVYLVKSNKKRIDLSEDFFYCLLSKLLDSKDNKFLIETTDYKKAKVTTYEISLKEVKND